MSNNIICQRLEALTVAIRSDPQSTNNIGTGFIVSWEKGLILTCAHVVRDACRCKPVVAESKVGIYFPKAIDEQCKNQWATVAACLPDYDDDVILLKLDNKLSSTDQSLFEIGKATISFDNRFYSYGFGKTNKDSYFTMTIHGRISGQVDADLKLNIRRVSLALDNAILEGHSGSPVLDMELNRIVGIVIEADNPNRSGIATDCEIITLAPFAQFGIPIVDIPMPKGATRTPSDEVLATVRDWVNTAPKEESFGVPSIVPDWEWVGREELLRKLSEVWENPSKRVTALIGLGGEGKSSLAQRWLNTIEADGVFWWSFYNRSGVNEFFEAAFHYLVGRTPKSNWALYLGSLLYTGKYLFVLDGFEVMQGSDFDQYGEIINSDLQLFLEYFVSPAHESRCLITSRIPLKFGHYTTFAHYDVDRLSSDEGKALLQRLGVNDDDAKLHTVVQTWEGHALTLSLIGSYLHACYGGRVVFDHSIHIEDLLNLVGDERRTVQVQRVLSRYDNSLLDETAQSFLLIFSIFRLPVRPDAFSQIFRSPFTPSLKRSIATMSDQAFDDLIERLKGYHIIRHESSEDQYTLHPLIRDHYTKKLKVEYPDETQPLHCLIKDYYLDRATVSFNMPTLKDLTPLIEAIHHACCATEYDKGFDLYTRLLTITEFHVRDVPFFEIVMNWLGAYEVMLSTLTEFLNKDDPQVSNPKDRSSILKDIGFCRMHLGHLNDAKDYYHRAITGYRDEAQWGQTSRVYYNLAMLHYYAGRLADSVAAAEDALRFVVRPDDPQILEAGEFEENPTDAVATWALLGFIDALCGDTGSAELSFRQAKELHNTTAKPHITLPIKSGVLYAIYLCRTGQLEKAMQTVEVLLNEHQPRDHIAEHSRCYRILGDITASRNDYQLAHEYYNRAVKFAREIFRRDILIEGLSARGRLFARQVYIDAARSDLEEALIYANNIYRIYEADIRVGLGWMHLATNDHDSAKREAEAAEHISEEVGYDWGRRDAGELLRLIAAEMK